MSDIVTPGSCHVHVHHFTDEPIARADWMVPGGALLTLSMPPEDGRYAEVYLSAQNIRELASDLVPSPTVTTEQVEAAARALLDHENDTWSKEARDGLWQATEAIGVQDEYRGQVAVVLDALGISHDGPHWEEVQP